jgi:hypothetical protein
VAGLMPALITTLIDKRDNVEVVRDRIAEILLTEVAEQQVLAATALKNPDLWKLRVFLERTNPWEEFLPIDVPDDEPLPPYSPPIVNIWWETTTFDGRTSDQVERQRASGTFNIDCYGYGVSSDLPGTEHDPGDQRAVVEVGRAVRLVRNILMAGPYTFLGLPRKAEQFVWGRRIQSITALKAQLGDRPAFHVAGTRIAFQVDFNEFSPQVVGVALEEVAIAILKHPSGEVHLTFQVGESPAPP